MLVELLRLLLPVSPQQQKLTLENYRLKREIDRLKEKLCLQKDHKAVLMCALHIDGEQQANNLIEQVFAGDSFSFEQRMFLAEGVDDFLANGYARHLEKRSAASQGVELDAGLDVEKRYIEEAREKLTKQFGGKDA